MFWTVFFIVLAVLFVIASFGFGAGMASAITWRFDSDWLIGLVFAFCILTGGFWLLVLPVVWLAIESWRWVKYIFSPLYFAVVMGFEYGEGISEDLFN